MRLKISRVKFTPASREQCEVGLLGWIACRLNHDLQLDGLTLRRGLDGRLRLNFPARRDSRQRQRFYLRPIGDRARRAIEQQVFQALRLHEAEVR